MIKIFLKIKQIIIILSTLDISLIKALIKGVAAGTEHIEFLNKLNNLNTIIDIGAHNGQFALIAKYKFKKSKIYSFDPLSESKKKYQDSLKDKKKCFFFNCAIGNKNTNGKINISQNSDSSSILSISKRQTEIFKNTKKIGVQDIKIKKLNYYLKKKDLKKYSLLKIDVQGYELNALKGCEDLLNNIQYIYIECSYEELYKKQPLFNQINRWLTKKNFYLKQKFNTLYDNKGKPVQADFFFENLFRN